MAGSIVLCWWIVRRGTRAFVETRPFKALSAFTIAALMTSGALAWTVLRSSARDPLTGTHDPVVFSMDLLAPFVYGGHWRFGWLTRPYWIQEWANPHESSVHLGLSVIALIVYVWRARRRWSTPIVEVFFVLTLSFLILALGPRLHIVGRIVPGRFLVLPYALLRTIFPPLALSGVPVRMMVIVTLGAGVLAAVGFTLLLNGPSRRAGAAVALACVLVVEYLPRPIPMAAMRVPAYVTVLRDRPGRDGTIDLVSNESAALFYQTIHQKPLAFGYLARLPTSVVSQDARLRQLIELGRFDRLWPQYGLRYVVARDATPGLRTWPGAATVWTDGSIAVVDVSHLDAALSDRR
jgi:hypothetical protein